MYNLLKSGMLIIVMTLLMIFIGGAFGGQNGAIVFFIISMVFNVFSYLFSHKIVIAMYRAKKADPAQYKELYATLEELSNRAQLPKIPELYIVPMDVPNAFATGRSPSKAIVAVTTGLLSTLRKDEIAAVIAHELGHIKNWDMLISTIVASMASAIMWMSYIAKWGAIFGGRSDDDEGGGIFGLLFMAIIAPLAATLVQMGVSRSREYMADDYSAKIMGTGEPLVNALLSLHGESKYHRETAEAITPATAHMFIFPSNFGGGLMKLFSTHPALEDRIKNLRKS